MPTLLLIAARRAPTRAKIPRQAGRRFGELGIVAFSEGVGIGRRSIGEAERPAWTANAVVNVGRQGADKLAFARKQINFGQGLEAAGPKEARPVYDASDYWSRGARSSRPEPSTSGIIIIDPNPRVGIGDRGDVRGAAGAAHNSRDAVLVAGTRFIEAGAAAGSRKAIGTVPCGFALERAGGLVAADRGPADSNRMETRPDKTPLCNLQPPRNR